MATFFNQATLSYNGNVVNSNVVSGEVVAVLSATKTAIGGGYGETDEVTYVINIINSGATAYTGLTVTDDLGAYDQNGTTVTPLDYVDGSLRYFINGTLTTAPTVVAGPPLSITGINIPANSNAYIVYQARLNEFAPLDGGSSITNTATLNGAGISAVDAAATLPVDNFIDLTINKSVTPTTVSENGQVTYTFVIQNTGNRETNVADNVVVTDLFAPVLNPITSVTVDGTPLALGTGYTYDTGSGVFSTVAGAITVPAATFTRNPDTGAVVVTPGSTVLTVTGNITG